MRSRRTAPPPGARRAADCARVTVWTVIAVVSLLAWLWLLLGQGFFWRTDVTAAAAAPRRRSGRRSPSWCRRGTRRRCSPVSLPSLLAQRVSGPGARCSWWTTAARTAPGTLARELAERGGGLPLTVTSPGEPPAGWTGKLWAVRHGIGAAAGSAPAGVPAAHGRRHRPRAGQSLRALVDGGDRRRLRPGLADGPAAGGDRLGAADRAGLRLLLRAAVPVPVDQPTARPGRRPRPAAAC